MIGLLAFPLSLVLTALFILLVRSSTSRVEAAAMTSVDVSFVSDVIRAAADYPYRTAAELHRRGRDVLVIAAYPYDVAQSIDESAMNMLGKCCGHSRGAHGSAHMGAVKFCIACDGAQHDFVPEKADEELLLERVLVEMRLARETIDRFAALLGVPRWRVTLIERPPIGEVRLIRATVLGEITRRVLADEAAVDRVFARFVVPRERRRLGVSP